MPPASWLLPWITPGDGQSTNLAKLLEPDDEDLHVLVALEAAEAARSLEHAHENPAKDLGAAVPALHSPCGSADATVHVLDRVRRRERAGERRRETKAVDGERLVETFAQRRGRARVLLLERAGEIVEQALRSLDLCTLVCLTHRRSNVGVPLVREVTEHVPNLVNLAALYERTLAVNVPDRGAQSFAPV